jgi:MFS family permease
VKETAGDLRISLASSTQAVQYMAIGTLQAFLPLYGLSVGLNASQIGILFGAQALVTILSKPFLGRWSDRIGRKPVILAGLGLSALIVAGIPWAGGFPLLLLLSSAFGLGMALVTSSAPALVADLCREKHYGSALGLFGTIMDIGHAGGPIVSGFLIASQGYKAAFALVSLLLVVSAGLFAAGVRTPVSLSS